MTRRSLPVAASVAAMLAFAQLTHAVEIRITSHAEGDVIHGKVEFRGTAKDAVEVAVAIDRGPFVKANGTENWWILLDFTDRPKRHYRISARAKDAQGNVVHHPIWVIVNDQSPPRPDCDELYPGAPLPYVNPAAPLRLDLTDEPVVYLEIIGHSENRGYDDDLQKLLDAHPPGGKKYVVTNHWIGGHETWRWVTPGSAGYDKIEELLGDIKGPTLALILTSNNATYPAKVPDMGDENYRRFVAECEKLADHLRNDGRGVLMCYFSAHRMKPTNLMPCYYENLAIGDLLEGVGGAGKHYVKSGPEQHNLHWCCYSACYASDHTHTNDAGDALMARAWYNLLRREIAGGDMNCDGELDLIDVEHFIQALLDPDKYQQTHPDCDLLNGDLELDGEIDLLDVEPYIDLLIG